MYFFNHVCQLDWMGAGVQAEKMHKLVYRFVLLRSVRVCCAQLLQEAMNVVDLFCITGATIVMNGKDEVGDVKHFINQVTPVSMEPTSPSSSKL